MGKSKIVLAEDNTTLSLLLKFRLEKDGYELLMANDGKQAVEIIETQSPDLILTDIMMPYVSGLEVISHLRNKVLLMPMSLLLCSGCVKCFHPLEIKTIPVMILSKSKAQSV